MNNMQHVSTNGARVATMPHAPTKFDRHHERRKIAGAMLKLKNIDELETTDIAARFGMPPDKAHREMYLERRRVGIEVAKTKWPHVGIPEYPWQLLDNMEIRDEVIVRLWKAGISRHEIAKCFDMTAHATIQVVERHGAKEAVRAGGDETTPQPQPDKPPENAPPLEDMPRKPPAELPTDPPPERKQYTGRTPYHDHLTDVRRADDDGMQKVADFTFGTMAFASLLVMAANANDFSRAAASIVNVLRIASPESVQPAVYGLASALVTEAAKAAPRGEYL